MDIRFRTSSITVDEFVALAGGADPERDERLPREVLVLEGYISYDGSKHPDALLFGGVGASELAIPNDCIESIRLGSSVQGGDAQGSHMWSATLFLKPPSPENSESTFFAALLSGVLSGNRNHGLTKSIPDAKDLQYVWVQNYPLVVRQYP